MGPKLPAINPVRCCPKSPLDHNKSFFICYAAPCTIKMVHFPRAFSLDVLDSVFYGCSRLLQCNLRVMKNLYFCILERNLLITAVTSLVVVYRYH